MKYYASFVSEKSVHSYEINKNSQYFILIMLKINLCQNGEIYREEINRYFYIDNFILFSLVAKNVSMGHIL